MFVIFSGLQKYYNRDEVEFVLICSSVRILKRCVYKTMERAQLVKGRCRIERCLHARCSCVKMIGRRILHVKIVSTDITIAVTHWA